MFWLGLAAGLVIGIFMGVQLAKQDREPVVLPGEEDERPEEVEEDEEEREFYKAPSHCTNCGHTDPEGEFDFGAEIEDHDCDHCGTENLRRGIKDGTT